MNARALRVKKSNTRRRRKLARDRRANPPVTRDPNPRGWSAARKHRKALPLWRSSRRIKSGAARLKYVVERWSVKEPAIKEEKQDDIEAPA